MNGISYSPENIGLLQKDSSAEDEAIRKLQAMILMQMDEDTVTASFLLAHITCQSESASEKIWIWMIEQIIHRHYGTAPFMLADLLYHILDTAITQYKRLTSLPAVFDRYLRGEPPILQTVLLYNLASMAQAHRWKWARTIFAWAVQHPLSENRAIAESLRRYIGRRATRQDCKGVQKDINNWMEGMVLPGSDHIRLLRHFIVFERRPGHCATWLAQARSLGDACRKWVLDQCARPGKGNTLVANFGDYGEVACDHPLACIEALYKVQDSHIRGWDGWEIRELRDEAYNGDCRSLLQRRPAQYSRIHRGMPSAFPLGVPSPASAGLCLVFA
ncbi:MAG: hypothetical protein IT210_21225 [Armatimonadetes bacterium]|nr:hypothetical protein [Armatimonadota bacterium]